VQVEEPAADTEIALDTKIAAPLLGGAEAASGEDVEKVGLAADVDGVEW
jgi:hypothetical protein